MSHRLNALFLASALALAGCASTASTAAVEPAPPAGPGSALASVAPTNEEMMTGSRIPKRKSTDRMLKTVGAQEARDSLDRSMVPLNSDGSR